MQMPIRQDWSQGCADAHLRAMRRAPRSDLARLACSYDWSAHPEPVLGWVMAQRRIELAVALTVFLRGAPERFNYMPKRDVPPQHEAEARLLDNICLRINSGYYLPGARVPAADVARIEKWLAAQKDDRSEGTGGRWILEEAIVERVLIQAGAPAEATDNRLDTAALRRGRLFALLAPLLRRRA
ncbi:hypothetical protein [Roseovarius nanhaiticus]|uniref:hypothetical protein n=1 Tax=Roseovarius nanhaiticus TaxID=573024 RepID=UPI00249388EB|nr:hypothetical protein [Roseovarius nanhaiticus]